MSYHHDFLNVHICNILGCLFLFFPSIQFLSAHLSVFQAGYEAPNIFSISLGKLHWRKKKVFAFDDHPITDEMACSFHFFLQQPYHHFHNCAHINIYLSSQRI